MPRPTGIDDATELHSYLDAFESIYYRDGSVKLEDHLPSHDHPLYLQILKEMVCVDLEFAWERGETATTGDYLDRFPELRNDAYLLAAVVQEELRQRREAGENPKPADFERLYNVDLSEIDIDRAPDSSAGLASDEKNWSTSEPSTMSAVRMTIAERVELQQAAREFGKLRARGADDEALQSWLDSKAPDCLHVSFLRDLYREDPRGVEDFSAALSELPEVGENFLDFVIVQELGKGAFGSVFLARQKSLANRPVALKVSPDVVYESRMLAQLQHTNIVPVYSLHRHKAQQAVCMPYLGGVTFVHVLKELRLARSLPKTGDDLLQALDCCVFRQAGLEEANAAQTEVFREELQRLAYPDAVAHLFTKIADGLQHAHLRGIVHQDLKPANLLLTDEAQPMLLDFNLSQDAKLSDSAARAMIGGTLPYMAPEVIDAFRRSQPIRDCRSDIYSLGVIFFEMLTLQHPFPIRRGSVERVAEDMLNDRSHTTPNPRTLNPSVSPALGAIVEKCLQPDPNKRYNSASQLLCDLKLHAENRPLVHAENPSVVERFAKWRRRHPRMTSSSGVAGLSLVVVLCLASAMLSWKSQWAAANAQEQVRLLSQDLESARELQYAHDQVLSADRLQQSEQVHTQALARFGVEEGTDWHRRSPFVLLSKDEQQQVRRNLAELTLLLARTQFKLAHVHSNPKLRQQVIRTALELNEAAEQFLGFEPASMALQRDFMQQVLTSEDAYASAEFDLPAVSSIDGGWDALLLAAIYFDVKQVELALEQARAAQSQEPDLFWAYWVAGICETNLKKWEDAKDSFDLCIAARPEYAPAYSRRALCWRRMSRPRKAIEDYSTVMKLEQPTFGLHIARGQTYLELGDHKHALADFQVALGQQTDNGVAARLLAQSYRSLGNIEAAEKYEALADPSGATGWYNQKFEAESLIAKKEYNAAVKLLRKAVTVSKGAGSLRLILAEVLSTHLHQHEEAIQELERAHAEDPKLPPDARRAVYLARSGQRDAAIEEANKALSINPDVPEVIYDAARVYSLTSRIEPGDASHALKYLRRALLMGYPTDYLDETDLEPICALDEYKTMIGADQSD